MTPDAHKSSDAPAPHPGDPDDGAAPDLLLAEPDESLASDVTARLAMAGLETVVCRDGAEALLQVGARRPAAVLLATPLPVVGAATVTRLLADLHPVTVMVGAGTDGTAEATAALEAGAVAIVARPYRTGEILPLLISDRTGGKDEAAQPLVVGDIELDPAGFHVFVGGELIPRMPVREFLLLRYLMEHANRVVSRLELIQELWGKDSMESNSLTVHIRRVRNRLVKDGRSCCTITAIRGLGYRLECNPTSSLAAAPDTDRASAARQESCRP
ncbi:winged helix-turn-helix transcriptional regulator [Streptomyces sp. URMC 125]|uniref:winged helix-turn-helix transcriptional regulator n=1 Tax=Streptomyces sp. URMC 125 TaxID=3423419 RepID=UPI003F1DBA91